MLDFITSRANISYPENNSSIASRYLKQPVTNNYDGTPEVPPTSNIKGIDLVTEGVLTMNRTLYLLRELAKDDVDFDIFLQLDEDNGAAKLAKIISEECTDLNLFVGKATTQPMKLCSLMSASGITLSSSSKKQQKSLAKTSPYGIIKADTKMPQFC